MSRVKGRLEQVRRQAETGAAVLQRLSAPVARRTRPFVALLTPVGAGVLAVGLLAWLLGVELGWLELFLAASACLLALGLSVPFVLGGAVLDTRLDISPDRVFVGTPSAGRLVVRNGSGRRLLPVQVDLPVGGAVARFDVPSLGGEQEHEEIFVVPTQRRAVIRIGPALCVQGDPLGLLQREVSTSPSIELFVHPTVVAMPALASGLLRDLEGQTTRDLSHSDLAFHTLREYVPGDDRRHVHWRSSAKAGKLLVRQFLDTRRSRVTIAVDAATASYRDEDEFELAISAAASLGLRCLRDELDVTVVAGGQATTPTSGRHLLDTLSRSSLGGEERGLAAATSRAGRLASDTSLGVLVTGSTITFAELRAAAVRFGPDVTPLALRVEPGAPAGVSSSGGMTVLAVRLLADLPRLLVAAVS